MRKLPTGSVTHWLREVRDSSSGATEAEYALVERFFARLSALAHQRMPTSSRRIADGDDVAISALNSFLVRVRRGEYPQLSDRTGLWPLLAKITMRKAIRQVEYEQRAKRGGQIQQHMMWPR